MQKRHLLIKRLLSGLGGWLAVGMGCYAGSTIEPPATLLNTARQYLTEAVADRHHGRSEIHMGRLDPRLRLSRCASPLQAFQASGARLSGATSVGVRCPDTGGWTIYVPATVEIFDQALVTTRALNRGTAVGAGDVQVIEVAVSQLGHGHLRANDRIAGHLLRRSVPSGTVLTPAMLSVPDLIRRGSRVVLVNRVGPIKVEMQGEALADAAQGERVRVRALNSGEIIEGWVESASVVKVTL